MTYRITTRDLIKNPKILTEHNDLINIPKKGLSPVDLNIFTCICYCIQGKGLEVVEIPLDTLKVLSKYKNVNDKRFIDILETLFVKVSEMFIEYEDGSYKKDLHMFHVYDIDLENRILVLQIEKEYLYLLNNLTNNFTKLDIGEQTALKSPYSKRLYEKLRQYRFSQTKEEKTAWYQASLEDFSKYMGIPVSYKPKRVKEKVVNVAIEELSPYFKNLKYEPIYRHKTGEAGRSKLVAVRFMFTPHKRVAPEYIELLETDRIGQAQGKEKTNRFCQFCGKRLWKMDNNDLYGHPDFRTGDCNKTIRAHDYETLIDNTLSLDEARKHFPDVLIDEE